MLHNVAKTYAQRPSQLLGLTPEKDGGWICYLVDRRVWQFGTAVQNDLEKEGSKEHGKPEKRLREILTSKTYKPGQKTKGTAEQLLMMVGQQ